MREPAPHTPARRLPHLTAAALCLCTCACITSPTAPRAASTNAPATSAPPHAIHPAHHELASAATSHAPRTTNHEPPSHPAITTIAHDPRMPLAGPPACDPSLLHPSAILPHPFAPAQPFPLTTPALGPVREPPLPIFDRHPDDLADELLCDGGDRALPVHYDRHFRHGLDTEDTVAEFVDRDGRWHVRPSNTVCLYAPRFGQVRTLTAPSEDLQVVRLAAHDAPRTGVALIDRTGIVRYTQPEAIGSLHVRSRPGSLETEDLIAGVHLPLGPAIFNRPETALENITFFFTGLITETESPFLAEVVQAALEWTRDEFPAVLASTAAGQELYVSFTGAEIIGLDDRRIPSDLRIVKAADRATARPGDIVTFTLRYDNLGDFELYHVRIIDNLTPRLEYIADSATSDRPGSITVEDNAEGSVVLTFELDAPLPPRTGGTITFQTRVR